MKKQFGHLPREQLFSQNVTAGPMTKSNLAKEINLNQPGVEYDGAIPHEWLEGFLTHCKRNDLAINHPLVTSTTWWVYYEGDAIGIPVSGCSEVQWAIEAYTKELNQ